MNLYLIAYPQKLTGAKEEMNKSLFKMAEFSMSINSEEQNQYHGYKEKNFIRIV